MKPVRVATRPSDRALQRALLQFFLPENYFQVKKALKRAGREDLIGDGPECLIPASPSPAGAGGARRGGSQKETARQRGAPRGSDRKTREGYRWAARKAADAEPQGEVL